MLSLPKKGAKTAIEYIPFLTSVEGERPFLVLTDYSLLCLYEVEFPSGECRTEAELRQMSELLAAHLLENHLFLGTSISLTAIVLEGPDPVLLERFKAVQSQESFFASERAKILSSPETNAVHRRFYAGLNIPVLEKEVSAAEFEKVYLDRLRQAEALASEFAEFWGRFAEVKALSVKEMVRAYWRLLNPWLPEPKEIQFDDLLCSDLVERDDGLAYGGKIIRTYSLFLPDQVGVWEIWRSFMSITFPCVLTIHANIPKNPKDYLNNLEKSKFLTKMVAWGLGRAHNDAKVKAINNLIKDIVETSSVPVEVALFARTWGEAESKTKDSIVERHISLISRFSEAGFKVYQEIAYQAQNFLRWTLPGLGRYSPDFRFTALSSKKACEFFPLAGEFVGEKYYPACLYLNRYKGVAGLNLISERQNKWGAFVVAPSGSGKTFFVNNIIASLSTLKEPPFIGVIDLAYVPSFLELVRSLGGQAICIDTSGKESINPLEFVFPRLEPTEKHLAFLCEVFFPLIMENPTKAGLRVLEKALRKVYYLFLQESPRPIDLWEMEEESFLRLLGEEAPLAGFGTWLEARNHFLERWRTEGDPRWLKAARVAHSQTMPLIRDLLRVLATDQELLVTSVDREEADSVRRQIESFVMGVRNAMFNRPSTLGGEELNQDIVYFYFGDVVNFPELLTAVFLLTHHYLRESAIVTPTERHWFEAVYGEETTRRLAARKSVFIVDEAHNLTRSDICMGVVEKDYLQGRALGLSTVLIFQTLEKAASTEEGRSALQNAALKIFLQHTSPEAPNEQGVEFISRVFGFNSTMKQVLLSVRRTSTYSELLVLSEGVGSGVIRFVPTPREYWIGTTHDFERALRSEVIRELVKLGYAPKQAFEKAIVWLGKEFPKGAARLHPRPNVEDILAKVRAEHQAS